MTESFTRTSRSRRVVALMAWGGLIFTAWCFTSARWHGTLRTVPEEWVTFILAAFSAFVAVFAWMLFNPAKRSAVESPSLSLAAAATLFPPPIIGFCLMPASSPLAGWLALAIFLLCVIAILSHVPDDFFAVPRSRSTYLMPLPAFDRVEGDVMDPDAAWFRFTDLSAVVADTERPSLAPRAYLQRDTVRPQPSVKAEVAPLSDVHDILGADFDVGLLDDPLWDQDEDFASPKKRPESDTSKPQQRAGLAPRQSPLNPGPSARSAQQGTGSSGELDRRPSRYQPGSRTAETPTAESTPRQESRSPAKTERVSEHTVQPPAAPLLQERPQQYSTHNPQPRADRNRHVSESNRATTNRSVADPVITEDQQTAQRAERRAAQTPPTSEQHKESHVGSHESQSAKVVPPVVPVPFNLPDISRTEATDSDRRAGSQPASTTQSPSQAPDAGTASWRRPRREQPETQTDVADSPITAYQQQTVAEERPAVAKRPVSEASDFLTEQRDDFSEDMTAAEARPQSLMGMPIARETSKPQAPVEQRLAESQTKADAGSERRAQPKIERTTEEDGSEFVEGVMTVRFDKGQKRANLHVPFSPPLPGTPEVECEWAGDEPLRLKVPVRQPYGIRIEARRSNADEALETEISFAAACSPE